MKPNTRQEVLDESDGHCRYCGKRIDGTWHLEHINPKYRGGEDDKKNLGVACASCNLRKSAFTIEKWKTILATKIINRIVKQTLDYLAFIEDYINDAERQKIVDGLETFVVTMKYVDIKFHYERED